MKRGQITFFVILGILIAAIVILFSYYFYVAKIPGTIPTSIPEEIKQTIDGCFIDAVEEGILIVGKQGGYYELPEKSTIVTAVNCEISNELNDSDCYYEFFIVPFYFYNGKNRMPTIETIRDEISKAVSELTLLCLQVVEEKWYAKGYKLEYDKIIEEIEVKTNKEKIEVSLILPVLIKGNVSSYKMGDFYKEVNLDLTEIYGQISSVISEQENEPSMVPIGFIIGNAYENEFKFEQYTLDENEIAFVFYYNETIGGEQFIFSFAMKYE